MRKEALNGQAEVRILHRTVPPRGYQPDVGIAAGPRIRRASRRTRIRRGVERRAPLRGQRDHQLTGDLHRRSRRTGEENPLRHRGHLARVPQPALGRRPPDAARSPHPRPHHRRDGTGLAAQRFRDDRPDPDRHPRAPRDQPRHRRTPVGRGDRDGENPHPRTDRRAAATRAVLRRRHSAGGGGGRLTDGCTAGRQARHRPAVDRGDAGRRRLRRARISLGHRRRAGGRIRHAGRPQQLEPGRADAHRRDGGAGPRRRADSGSSPGSATSRRWPRSRR